MSCSKSLHDDEYIAKLLAEDAKKSSLRYAQQGLSALLPRRPTGTAPKPNTRFLKAIVREADTHNAALNKEELEARIRQRELGGRTRYGSVKGTSEDADGRSLKRRRNDDGEDHGHIRRLQRGKDYGCRNTSSERHRNQERNHHRSKGDRHMGSQLDGASGKDRRKHSSRPSSQSRSEDRRDRNRTADKGGADDDHYRRRRRTSRSRSAPSTTPAGQIELKTTGRDNAEIIHAATVGHASPEDERHNVPNDYESDPLEILVGQLVRSRGESIPKERPPVRSKGRGAYRPSGAAMDAHFSSDYNPAMDLYPDSEVHEEKEDWDMALEALRDREMFKQKQGERLREAGFGDAEIKKWTDGEKEKDVKDVKWSSRSEAREWDIGKVYSK